MRCIKKIVSVVLFFTCLCSAFSIAGPEEFSHPLINPFTNSAESPNAPELPEEMINILLVGIDYGEQGYRGSGHKKTLEACHADAMLVLSIHPETGRIDLVSIPRDTVTYVPGVRGIYKLNAAINCGDGTVEDGLAKACAAASWVLGGIPIDYYCAVDMVTMVALGDIMSGIDFEIEMSYTGHSGNRYTKGKTHLDGLGIMDYLRSRTNATYAGNDLGRTARHRALIIAIFRKLNSDKVLLLKMAAEIQKSDGFFTNISISSLLPFLSMGMQIEESDIGSHVITGKYRTALMGWNFTFTDQKHRQEVIKEVYGIDVPPLPYVSFEYAKWLVDSGFSAVHQLTVAEELMAYCMSIPQDASSEEQSKGLANLEATYNEAASAFVTASDSMRAADARRLRTSMASLRRAGDAAAELYGHPSVKWTGNKYWYRNPSINEKPNIDWR